LRIEGTRNLVQAAKMAGVSRAIAQSIAFVYVPGEGMRAEDDPLDLAAEGVRRLTVQGVVALERQVLENPISTGSCCAMVISMDRTLGTPHRRNLHRCMSTLSRIPRCWP
jgi:hypothetical protein